MMWKSKCVKNTDNGNNNDDDSNNVFNWGPLCTEYECTELLLQPLHPVSFCIAVLKVTSLGQDAYGLHMVAYGGMGSKNRNGAAPTIPSVSRMSRLSQEWDQDSRNVLVINQLSSIRTRELVGCSVCHCKKVVRDKSRMGVGSWQTHACLPPQMI